MKRLFFTLLGLGAAYSLNAQTTVTFNYTGSVQTFVVPNSVYSVTVDARGGEGGSNQAAGGKGGRVQGVLPVTPGDTLYIFVGAAGTDSTISAPYVFYGGGSVYSYSTCGTAGTGGGGTDIRVGDTNLISRVIVAGGGGGAGGYVQGNQTYAGGDGGGLIAMDGVPWPNWPQSGGGGGNQSAGGLAGVACCSCPTYTTAGVSGFGGSGSGDCAGGGGGGGGYYGGGGSCFGGGGGGSSYTSGTVTGVVHTQGFQTGAGMLTLTYVVSVGISEPLSKIDLTVYPNPFAGKITLSLNSGSGNAVIYDILGNKVASFKVHKGEQVFDGSFLKPGAYFLELKTAAGSRTVKIVKD